MSSNSRRILATGSVRFALYKSYKTSFSMVKVSFNDKSAPGGEYFSAFVNTSLAVFARLMLRAARRASIPAARQKSSEGDTLEWYGI